MFIAVYILNIVLYFKDVIKYEIGTTSVHVRHLLSKRDKTLTVTREISIKREIIDKDIYLIYLQLL